MFKKFLITPPNREYVYFPLHMTFESMLDTWSPEFQDQMLFVKQLSKTIPVNYDFLVKLHYSDANRYSKSLITKLEKQFYVKFVHPRANNREFLLKSDIVIALSGTSALEAAIIGKPVIIFGNSPYQYFPNTYKIDNINDMSIILKKINKVKYVDEKEIEKSFKAYVKRFMPSINNYNWHQKHAKEDFKNFIQCFDKLIKYIKENKTKSIT